MAEEFHGPRPESEDRQQTRPINPTTSEEVKGNRVIEWVKNLFTRRDKTTHREVEKPETPRFRPPERPEQDKQQPENFDKTHAREKLFLAEQGTDGLQVLPGNHWAMHYPNGAEEKKAAVERLFDGSSRPSAEIANVTPDALIYDQKDIQRHGLDPVRQRIDKTVTTFENFDFPRFTAFVSEMSGTTMTPEMAEKYYHTIAEDKAKQVMLNTYDHADKDAVIASLRQEITSVATNAASIEPMQKILSAGGINALNPQGMGMFQEQRQIEDSLQSDQKAIYEEIKSAYKDYIEHGDEQAYRTIVETIKSFHAAEQEQQTQEEKPTPPSESELSEPPEASDEYNPPKESDPTNKRYYEVTPAGKNTEPPQGYYASRKDSDFDFDTKSWSTPTRVVPWTQSISGDDRQTITGISGTTTFGIPVPEGYALDMNSFKVSGNPTITRDQHGCFYIQNTERGQFKIDFVKEEPPFQKDASFADTQTIHRGLLTHDAESFIAELKQANVPAIERAEKILEFIHQRHVYPADFAEAAQIQDELRNRSTPDNYIQTLELSRKLECLSANTLFIAMLRHAGVSSRVIGGHNVSELTDQKVVMDESTSHAWSEVWDGDKWITMDATPPKEQQVQEQGNEGQEKESPSEFGEDGLPKEAVTDEEKAEAEKNLEASHEAAEQALQQRDHMQEQMENAASFQDFEDLKNDIANDPALFEDMKEALEKIIEAKEEQKKEEVKEELNQMMEDGFLSEEDEKRIRELIDQRSGQGLDELKRQIETESKAFQEFDNLREEVTPLVDEWYDYFVERLPKEDVIELDEDSTGRKGTINKQALKRPGSQMFGQVFNPRTFRPEIRPKFLASIAVDVSLSMATPTPGGSTRLDDAKKLMVFYNELFSRISKEHGYIRFSLYSFAKDVNVIKQFDQEYNSSERYDFPDGKQSTIKKRLMESLKLDQYTNMFGAVQTAAHDLNEEIQSYPDYASSLYFVGDGGDSFVHPETVRRFLAMSEEQGGFGDHNVHAIMLGDEQQKSILANSFGVTNTTVAPDFETLIEQSMYKFDEDMEDYFAGKVN